MKIKASGDNIRVSIEYLEGSECFPYAIRQIVRLLSRLPVFTQRVSKYRGCRLTADERVMLKRLKLCAPDGEVLLVMIDNRLCRVKEFIFPQSVVRKLDEIDEATLIAEEGVDRAADA